MEVNKENAIEFFTGQRKATVSFCSPKYINRVNKLKEKYPEEVEILAVNDDGSVYAHVPTKWIKINPPKQMEYTEEQRREISERLRKN